MDANRIRKLATGAREQLRREVAGRLDAVLAPGSAERLTDRAAVDALEARVESEGREAVVDSAAYTWFNRLCALRYMDARGYSPTPVVTPREGATLPAVLADAQRGLFDPAYAIAPEARSRVSSLLAGEGGAANAAEAAYAELLRAVCESYAGPMPFMFSERAASALLMPEGLLAGGSILRRIVEGMDAGSCGSVEVLGWLYQHYIAERKDEVFASFKKGKKAGPAEIGPATQLFTPKWIVRYLCENSLGRLWMLNEPGSSLAREMDYYIAPDGEEPHAEVSSASDIRVLDPACGSGHILVYAFDLLFAMYEEEGWLPEDVPAMVLRDNLRGLEVDPRAAEIASFALVCKALERDPRFLERGVSPDVRVLAPAALDDGERGLLSAGFLERAGLLEAMAHMSEVGSLYRPEPGDADAIRAEVGRLRPRAESGDAFAESALAKLGSMLANVDALAGEYHCVIANPPYMGTGSLSKDFGGWVKREYPDEKSDLCTCFMERGAMFTEKGGYTSMVTMQSWMFLGSYERMREKFLARDSVSSMAHLGTRAFDAIAGEVVSTTATVFLRGVSGAQEGSYFRLVDVPGEEAKRDAYLDAVRNHDCGWFYRRSADSFKSIPGTPIAYWASDSALYAFSNYSQASSLIKFAQGLKPAPNELFVRSWFEVSLIDTWLVRDKPSQGCFNSIKWYPISNGGNYRKWYGNRDDVVDWLDDGLAIRESKDENGKCRSRVQNERYYFEESLSWSALTSGPISVRISPAGSICAGAGYYIGAGALSAFVLGFLNSSVFTGLKSLLSQTLNNEVGDLSSAPINGNMFDNQTIDVLVRECISLCESDWDSFETSWDFKRHPLI